MKNLGSHETGRAAGSYGHAQILENGRPYESNRDSDEKLSRRSLRKANQITHVYYERGIGEDIAANSVSASETWRERAACYRACNTLTTASGERTGRLRSVDHSCALAQAANRISRIWSEQRHHEQALKKANGDYD